MKMDVNVEASGQVTLKRDDGHMFCLDMDTSRMLKQLMEERESRVIHMSGGVNIKVKLDHSLPPNALKLEGYPMMFFGEMEGSARRQAT